MVTELFPLKLAFRGLSDDPDGEDPTVVDAPGDLDDDDADEDETLPTDDAPSDDAEPLEQ